MMDVVYGQSEDVPNHGGRESWREGPYDDRGSQRNRVGEELNGQDYQAAVDEIRAELEKIIQGRSSRQRREINGG